MRTAPKQPRFKSPRSPREMEVRAYYEGAHSSPARSILPGIVQEARRDLSRCTRRELMRSSRALWKNNPMVKAVVERLVTYVVGTGIRPEPASSDEKWNRRAAKVFNSWAKRADISSKQSLWKLQEIAFRSTILDGDHFVLKTYGKSGRPRIQLIEASVVGHNKSADRWQDDDGMIADANGRPIEWVMQASGAQSTERRISAEDIVHLANIERTGQGRGAPMAASALTTAVDLHDILGLEKHAVKDASSKTDIIKTESGELPNDGGAVVGRSLRAKPGDTTKQVAEYYQQVFGPTARVLKRGDSYEGFEPKRPGPAWQGFVDFLAELVCLSFNLPPSLVRQLKVGGADTRRDLAIMQRVVDVWQQNIAHSWQEIYEYVIEAEIEDGALAGAPADWRETEWQFPRAATVDAGRMSQQDREDVRTGNMTLREYWGQYGLSWRESERQNGVEFATLLEIERDLELPRGTLVNRKFGAQGSPAIVDEIAEFRSFAEAYGIAVRAGVVTPNVSDEEFMRKRFSLPALPDAVRSAWEKDGGARRPITLASQEQADAEVAATTGSDAADTTEEDA